MKILGIDYEKCIKCKQCVKECPPRLYRASKDDEITFSDPLGSCIECGHCIAVCPKDAIKFEAPEAPLAYPGIEDPTELISYDTLLKFLRARRSIRQFRPDPVPEEEVDAVLEAMRYAPSASNAQGWRYIILTDPEKKRILADKTVAMLRLLRKVMKIKWLLKPFVSGQIKAQLTDPSTAASLDELLARHASGDDPIFYDAPCVIILHTSSYGHMAGNDAGLAFMHGMLAAQARGLGTCWIGFAEELLFRNKKMRKWLGIPSGHKPWGVMILGYPSVKYHRVPMRKPLKVRKVPG